MTNNEKFNVLLNSCAHAQQIYDFLMALAACQSLQQIDDVSQKRQIIVGKLFPALPEI